MDEQGQQPKPQELSLLHCRVEPGNARNFLYYLKLNSPSNVRKEKDGAVGPADSQSPNSRVL